MVYWLRHFLLIERIKLNLNSKIEGFNKRGFQIVLNVGKKESPFGDAGIICRRRVYSVDTKPIYAGPFMTLGGNIVSEELVPQDFFINDEELPKWRYEKGAKKINRVSKQGYEYVFFGRSNVLSGFNGSSITHHNNRLREETLLHGSKHVIKTSSGRYRRLMPIELKD